jgi:hypothetical protein
VVQSPGVKLLGGGETYSSRWADWGAALPKSHHVSPHPDNPSLSTNIGTHQQPTVYAESEALHVHAMVRNKFWTCIGVASGWKISLRKLRISLVRTPPSTVGSTPSAFPLWCWCRCFSCLISSHSLSSRPFCSAPRSPNLFKLLGTHAFTLSREVTTPPRSLNQSPAESFIVYPNFAAKCSSTEPASTTSLEGFILESNT